MKMYCRFPFLLLIAIALWVPGPILAASPEDSTASAKSDQPATEKPPTQPPKLVRAVMCEEMDNLAPKNAGIIFSLSRGGVSCFTDFDPVPEKTYIYHSWYRRDRLITTKRLTLKPPRWSSFSRVQLRKADTGPWRVEIRDNSGSLQRILRFSIID